MRRILGTALVCLLAGALTGTALAQTTSSLYGQVTNLSTGDPVAGAAVIATSVFGAFTTETDADGNYRIPFLRPGSYDVRVESSGYATIIQQDVRLSLGGRTELNFSLAPGKVETMTVTGESPVIDRSTTSIGVNIHESMMESVPIGRNFNNVFYLAPGVNTSRPGNTNDTLGSANPNVAGASGLENNFVVDGINITDTGFGALGAYSRVYGSLGTAINFDFIEEVQVKTGGYEPEFGQAAGGVLQALTKTGSNQFSGDVFLYYNGTNADGAPNYTPTPQGDVNLKEDGFTSTDYGLTMGGPFVRDKAFWFLAYNHVETDNDVFGASSDPNNVLFFDESNPITRTTEADNWAAKLSFDLTANHRLEVSGFADPTTRNLTGNRRGALLVNSNDTISWSQLEFGGRQFSMRYDGVVTPNFLIEALAAQAKNKFGEAFPQINDQPQTRDRRTNVTCGPDGICGNADDTGSDANVFVGGIGFYENTVQTNDQITLKLTNFIGNHELKYGVIYEDVEFTGLRDRTGSPWTIVQPGADGIPGTADDPSLFGQMSTSGPSIQIICDDNMSGIIADDPRCFNTGSGLPNRPSLMRISRGNTSTPQVTTTTEYWAPFIQDAWQATPYFVFKFGVRYENQKVSGGGGTFSEFTIDDSWAPRLGFTWDVNHDGKSKLYGSAGRFYSKIAQDLALRALSADVSLTRGDYYWTDPVADTNGDGVINQVDGIALALTNPVPTGRGGSSRFTVPGTHLTVVDESVENSYADEFVLGYEYEVAPNMAIGARIIYRELGAIMEDIAQNYASEVAAGPGNATFTGVTFGTYFITNPDTDTPAYHGPFTDPGPNGTIDRTAGADGVPGTPDDVLGDDIDCSGGTLNFPGFIIYDPGASPCLPWSTANDFPEAERTYLAAEITFEKRFFNNWQMLFSYRWSQSEGNYEGFFRSDNGQTDPNLTSLFDFPNEAIWRFTYEPGVLPTDREHIVRLNGSYTFNWGSTLGISYNLLSGAPLTILDAHPAYDNNGELVFEERGASGDTGTESILDVHFDYPVRLGQTELKFFLDVFNVFDTTRENAFDMDREVSVGNLNPDFQYAVNSIAPRTVRFGARFSW